MAASDLEIEPGSKLCNLDGDAAHDRAFRHATCWSLDSEARSPVELTAPAADPGHVECGASPVAQHGGPVMMNSCRACCLKTRTGSLEVAALMLHRMRITHSSTKYQGLPRSGLFLVW